MVVPDVLVSVDWLATQLIDPRSDQRAGQRSGQPASAPELIILDARPESDYRAGHIEHARSLPYTATYDSGPDNDKNVAPIPVINALLSAVGVSVDRPVIIYAGDDYRAAARLFWVLETHGHPSVAVLDGGVSAWRAQGHSLTQEVPAFAPSQYVTSFDPQRHADKLEVYRAIGDPDFEIVDSRSRPEYVGEAGRGDRRGHITTAIHEDSAQCVQEREAGIFTIDREALAEQFHDLPRDKTIYTYCNSGRRAAVNYLLLRSLGYDKVAVYDGSWLEWSADDNLPVTVGDQPGTADAGSAVGE